MMIAIMMVTLCVQVFLMVGLVFLPSVDIENDEVGKWCAFALVVLMQLVLNFGPGLSTYVLPTTTYPANIRSTFFGISSVRALLRCCYCCRRRRRRRRRRHRRRRCCCRCCHRPRRHVAPPPSCSCPSACLSASSFFSSSCPVRLAPAFVIYCHGTGDRTI